NVDLSKAKRWTPVLLVVCSGVIGRAAGREFHGSRVPALAQQKPLVHQVVARGGAEVVHELSPQGARAAGAIGEGHDPNGELVLVEQIGPPAPVAVGDDADAAIVEELEAVALGLGNVDAARHRIDEAGPLPHDADEPAFPALPTASFLRGLNFCAPALGARFGRFDTSALGGSEIGSVVG